MTREYIKGKLKTCNSGSDAYNRGIRDANRVAKIWINKAFDNFEESKCNHTYIDKTRTVSSEDIYFTQEYQQCVHCLEEK